MDIYVKIKTSGYPTQIIIIIVTNNRCTSNCIENKHLLADALARNVLQWLLVSIESLG